MQTGSNIYCGMIHWWTWLDSSKKKTKWIWLLHTVSRMEEAWFWKGERLLLCILDIPGWPHFWNAWLSHKFIYVLSSKDQEGRMYLHTSNMSLFMFNYSKSNKINIGQSYNRLGNLLSHCIILKIRIFKKIDTKWRNQKQVSTLTSLKELFWFVLLSLPCLLDAVIEVQAVPKVIDSKAHVL